MNPIHLPYADALAAAALAYDEGRLQAQTAPSSRCSYRSPRDNSPCAVGAAMTDEQAQILIDMGYNTWGVSDLIVNGLITTDNEDALIRLQGMHDDWSLAVHRGSLNASDCEARFKRLIGQ